MPAAALERAHPDPRAGGDARERVGDRDGVAVVAHHQHRHPFAPQRVVHPADREGRHPTHPLLFENAANAGRDIDRHGCGLLCVSLPVGALKHAMISRVPLPNCRSAVIGLAIAGNPENDGHLSPWQEALGRSASTWSAKAAR
jgi:hypothetical protein